MSSKYELENLKASQGLKKKHKLKIKKCDLQIKTNCQKYEARFFFLLVKVEGG